MPSQQAGQDPMWAGGRVGRHTGVCCSSGGEEQVLLSKSLGARGFELAKALACQCPHPPRMSGHKCFRTPPAPCKVSTAGPQANLCSKSYWPTLAVLSCTLHMETVMPEGFIKTFIVISGFWRSECPVLPPKSFPRRDGGWWSGLWRGSMKTFCLPTAVLLLRLRCSRIFHSCCLILRCSSSFLFLVAVFPKKGPQGLSNLPAARAFLGGGTSGVTQGTWTELTGPSVRVLFLQVILWFPPKITTEAHDCL